MRRLRTRDLGIVLVLILSILAWSGDTDLKLERALVKAEDSGAATQPGR